MALELPPSQHRGTGLVDVLDRVLDKGLVIAGDIKVFRAELAVARGVRKPVARKRPAARRRGEV